jgi:DedD protein
MEKHRILWVIFSLSLFLVVILAGGLYFLRPEPQAAAPDSTRAASSADQFDPFEFVRGTPEPPGLVSEPREPGADELILVVGEPGTEEPAAIQPEGPASEAARPEALPVARAPRAQPAAPAARAPALPVQPAPPRQVRVIEYWIQIGSYRSHSRAETVSAGLAEQGLESKISTRTLEGETYYRVRIGPYGDRREAEKFLDWLHSLSGFETSYISQVTSRRSVSN